MNKGFGDFWGTAEYERINPFHAGTDFPEKEKNNTYKNSHKEDKLLLSLLLFYKLLLKYRISHSYSAPSRFDWNSFARIKSANSSLKGISCETKADGVLSLMLTLWMQIARIQKYSNNYISIMEFCKGEM